MPTTLRVRILGLNYAPEPTGIAPYTTAVARFLADAGHDVDVVTGLPHYPRWELAPGYAHRRVQERDGRVRVTRVPHPIPDRPTGRQRVSMEAAFALQAAQVAGHRPDVVLTVSPALLTVAAGLRWRRRGRTALGVIVQDLYGRALAETGSLSEREARGAARLERALLRQADGVVAIHDRFRSSLTALGVARERITSIRNWTHLADEVGDVDALRAHLGWRDDEVVALHAGNMGAKQGLENVVEAARLADTLGLPVRFVLLGSGNQRRVLEHLGAGVTRLQFLDPLPTEHFRTALAAADVLVLNERPEISDMCVPSKLTSYFASGRPVVAASAVGGAAASELRLAGAGVRIDPGRPGELLETVLTLTADPDRVGEMGRCGREFAAAQLSEEAARAAYVDFVERLHRSLDPVTVPRPRRAEPPTRYQSPSSTVRLEAR